MNILAMFPHKFLVGKIQWTDQYTKYPKYDELVIEDAEHEHEPNNSEGTLYQEGIAVYESPGEMIADEIERYQQIKSSLVEIENNGHQVFRAAVSLNYHPTTIREPHEFQAGDGDEIEKGRSNTQHNSSIQQSRIFRHLPQYVS